MTLYVNQTNWGGTTGADIVVRESANGPYAFFNVANNEKNKDGSERLTWLRIVVQGKLAEACGKFVGKGSNVYCSGKLASNTYTKDGVTQTVIELRAFEVRFVELKKPAASAASSNEVPY